MFPSPVTYPVQRDSLHVYQQDVDLTCELTAYCGLRRKGKLLAPHMQLGCGLWLTLTMDWLHGRHIGGKLYKSI